MMEKQDLEWVDTEKTAESRSFHTLMLGPSKSFSLSPRRAPQGTHQKLSPKQSPFLKVSPRVVPRAVIHPAPAIKSLLLGAPLSHCNFMTGSARAPHKYDHFHEKTFIYDFVPSFRARKFAYGHYELPAALDVQSPSVSGRDAPLPTSTHRIRRRRPLQPRVVRVASSDRAAARLKSPLAAPEGPVSPARRPLLCLKDGTDLSQPDIHPFFLDFQSFIDRYIGAATPSTRREVFDRAKVSLRSQAYYSLLETATEALRPKRPFTKVFYVNGKEVTDLALVPEDCQAMLFSYREAFKGVKGLTG